MNAKRGAVDHVKAAVFVGLTVALVVLIAIRNNRNFAGCDFLVVVTLGGLLAAWRGFAKIAKENRAGAVKNLWWFVAFVAFVGWQYFDFKSQSFRSFREVDTSESFSIFVDYLILFVSLCVIFGAWEMKKEAARKAAKQAAKQAQREALLRPTGNYGNAHFATAEEAKAFGLEYED